MPLTMQKDTNLAYAIRNLEEQQAAREQQPQIKKVSKSQAIPKRKLIQISVCMLYVIGLCTALIIGKVQLTDTNMKLQDTKAAYTEVDSEKARLDAELGGLVSLKSVEERAKELGMGEVKQSQVDYIVVSHDNTVEVAEENNSISGQLTKWYHQIMEYILG